MIFILCIIVALVSGTYLFCSWDKEDKGKVYALTVCILSLVCIFSLGVSSLLIKIEPDTGRKKVETEYMLLQYRIRDYNDLTTEEKVDFLLTDTLMADIEKWNTSRNNYERNRNNIWVGFLFNNRYKNTDYISILGDDNG